MDSPRNCPPVPSVQYSAAHECKKDEGVMTPRVEATKIARSAARHFAPQTDADRSRTISTLEVISNAGFSER